MHGQPADIDPRIADDSDKALVASLNSGAVGDAHMPLRPDFGTEGREIKLRANFFPVEVPPGIKLYAYHVGITTPFVPCHLKSRIYDLATRTTAWIQAWMGLPGRVAHDNDARLVSAYPLPQPLVINVQYYDEGEGGPPKHGAEMYVLNILFVQEIDTAQLTSYLTGQIQYRNYNASPAVAALDLVFRSLQRRIGMVVGRNKYFSRSVADPFRLGGGVEAWKGIWTSTRSVYKQLMLNADLCATSFYTPGNLVHAIMALPDRALGVFLRGVRVEQEHIRLTLLNITMEDYLRRKYNIQLQFQDVQLVEVGGQSGTYLPAELCEILPGQPIRGKISDQQAVILSSVTSSPPNVNGEKIASQLHYQFGLNVERPELESFSITISPNMTIVPARILSRPSITYASNAAASIGNHAFWNLVGVKFAVGTRLDNWAVLVIKDGQSRAEFAGSSDGDLHGVVSAFRDMCNAGGMHVTANPTYATAQLQRSERSDPIRREAIQTIKNTLLDIRPKPAFVLVMLANVDQAIYEGVKQLCDVRLDVASVCVQSSKIRRRDPHYLANVISKINMKLGGVNHKLNGSGGEWLKKTPTMVVGIDVTHPNPGSSIGCPSIAAVVASVDSDFAQYPAILDIQESRKEMITTLRDMMVDRLRLFQKKNGGQLPERILIYRSGISETQFNILLETEKPSVIDAFKAFDSETPYRPKFAIVVCNKSRHVRFYPTEQDNATITGNPLPGTVVDRGITAIYNFDFFLQSHGNAGQGTARPTHYYVIYDDIKFNANEIQSATYALSYMFTRATQAISLVCPAYYADAACRRGRCYLRKLFHGYAGEEGATGPDVLQEARMLWGWGVAGAGLKETMFYL